MWIKWRPFSDFDIASDALYVPRIPRREFERLATQYLCFRRHQKEDVSDANREKMGMRTTPFGDIVAVSARGTCMGNRGIIHDADTKTLLTRRWQHQAWICCVLSFKGYQHPIMGPSAYTELFFLDEATALAAGHRPCAYCRRADFNAFKNAWIEAKRLGAVRKLSAPEMDRMLHRERVTRKREKVTYVARVDDLPDGTMVTESNQALLIAGDSVLPWTPQGYLQPLPRPVDMPITVLTPRSTVQTMTAGYVPTLHPSAKYT